MADYFLPRGDQLPDIVFTLTDATGAAVDLTGAAVSVVLRDVREQVITTTGTVSISSATGGVIRYQPQASDFPTVGDYFLRVRATFAGKPLTNPPDRWLWVVVS